LIDELQRFMRTYEAANNSHDFAKLEPLIASDATYWFTDGSYKGIAQIRKAIEETFARIQDEAYEISDLAWSVVEANVAVCTYRFVWHGIVNGEAKSGVGRGTNVLRKTDGTWRVVHEHLSV